MVAPGFRWGMAALVIQNRAYTLVLKVALNCSVLTPAIDFWAVRLPALFTSISRPPRPSAACCTSRVQNASLVMSPGSASALRPASCISLMTESRPASPLF